MPSLIGINAKASAAKVTEPKTVGFDQRTLAFVTETLSKLLSCETNILGLWAELKKLAKPALPEKLPLWKWVPGIAACALVFFLGAAVLWEQSKVRIVEVKTMLEITTLNKNVEELKRTITILNKKGDRLELEIMDLTRKVTLLEPKTPPLPVKAK